METPKPQKMPKYIMTSRFNKKTWEENQKYKETNKINCIYGSPELNTKITANSILFVLEMNNDTNKILGIGMVKNKPVCGKRIYTKGDYNRFVFTSKYHIKREEFDEEEMKLIKAFDIVCFTGNYHSKRGRGLTLFPKIMLEKAKPEFDLEEMLSEMFKKRATRN